MQSCCTHMELYHSLIKTRESTAFVALDVSFNSFYPLTLLIPVSYNPLCHKKPFQHTVWKPFQHTARKHFFLPQIFFPFMLFAQVINPSLPSLLSRHQQHTCSQVKIFSQTGCALYSYPLQENIDSVNIGTHLKRLSFLSISCKVFSAGLMICLKM